MIIGGDDTPAPPAGDLWSSDVRFTLTKSVCKTSEFGDSAAGCHGERSELGDASRETSPTLYCPVGGGRINKHPPHFKTPVKGTTLASAVLCSWHLQGFIVLCKMA